MPSPDGRSYVVVAGGMVHAAKNGDIGADQLDVFWPVRPDYVERAEKQRALYEQIVAPGTKPQKLSDGFTFTEGPTWLKGQLYFSDMFFQNPAAGDWTGSPAKSRLIAMTPDGKWRVLSRGMQSNGTIAAANGNLLVCDMFGHRVVEIDPRSGRVVRVVLDKVGGKPIDGPNDLVMDAKGGLYVTDPQFTPEAKKSQPGKQVYYVAPDGNAKVVIGPGEFAMPNGVELSPDGKTLYVNNTWAQPGENFVYAYDVAEDGSVSNKRQFAKLNLTPECSGPPIRSTGSIPAPMAPPSTPTDVTTSPRTPVCRSSFLTARTPARSGCRNIPSASPSVAPITMCCIWLANRPPGRFKPRSVDSGIRQE